MSNIQSSPILSNTHQRVITPVPSFRKELPADILKILQMMGRPDNWHNLLYIGLDWLIISGVSAICLALDMQWFIYLPVLVIIGARQRALMNLLHQASHQRLFRHTLLNDWLCRLLISFPLMTSLSAYTYAHRLHHAYLWNREIDPKSMRYKELGLLPPTRHLSMFIVRHLLVPFLLVHMPGNLLAALSWRDEKRLETWCRYSFWLAILILVIVTRTWHSLLFFWIIPYCTTFQIIRYLADMIDHAGLESRNPWLSTRTWEGSWILRAILAPHSDNYHLTHHLFPLIPHYRFAQAHRLLMNVPAYAGAHHCHNFFWSRRAGMPSIIEDILAPDHVKIRD